MEVLSAVSAWAATAVCRNTGLSDWSNALVSFNGTDLGARLSAGAILYEPGSSGFINATTRWSAFEAPVVSLVVVPSTEEDVAETVKFANQFDLPFLAISGKHGAISSIGQMQTGIEIWMDQLNNVTVSEDGASARIGGGSLSKKVLDSLWDANKQTVTGGCECTSLLGPGLGGGHGWLQGRHGLVADQFLSMNIVFANGSLQTIDEATDPDLWWALRGAGHNFGVVTSVEVKVYDVEYSDWAYEMFTFNSSKVEEFYDTINNVLPNNETEPVDIIHYGFFYNDATIDTSGPTTLFWILKEGATTIDSIYTQPFHDLEPVAVDVGSGNYLDLPVWTGMDNTAGPCQHTGISNMRFPVDIRKYDPQAMRTVYDTYAAASIETPELNGGFMLIEGYSVAGVKAVPSESTAFAFRDDNLLFAPVIHWNSTSAELDQKAINLGNQLRDIVHNATGQTELHAYVNYAAGGEGKQSWYGYEQWRQDKLLAVKDKYDPQRRFSFYAPIA
ncbi:putative FAD-dependent oxygenase [Pestalotiopsis sp. NC0098]|nr:putative FAD-dependent oxygenase [Pestalotiopsis sp. NC0098]